MVRESAPSAGGVSTGRLYQTISRITSNGGTGADDNTGAKLPLPVMPDSRKQIAGDLAGAQMIGLRSSSQPCNELEKNDFVHRRLARRVADVRATLPLVADKVAAFAHPVPDNNGGVNYRQQGGTRSGWF